MVRIYRARGVRSTATVPVFPTPELAQRAPTTSDTDYAQGQLWVHETANPVVIYVYHGLGSWVPISGAVNAADQFTTDNGVGVPQLGNLNIVGGTNVQTTAVGDTVTIDFAGAAGGASTFNTNSSPAVQVGGAISILGGTGLTSSGAGSAVTIDLDVPVGTGATSFTDGGILFGSGTNPVRATVQPTDGQLLIGRTGSDPLLNTLSSGDGSVIFTPGPGALDLRVPATGTNTFNADTGQAVESAVAIDILGGTGLTSSGAGSAVTIDLDVPVTVPNGGTGVTSLTDGGIVLGSGTGPVTVTAQPTDGQLLMGVSGSDPILGNLTSTGGTIIITPGPGALNLESVGGGGGANIFNTNSTPATQVGGAINIIGGNGLTTSGTSNTVTIDLDVPVTVPNGGTGATILTDGGIVLGSGTNPVTVTPQPTDGQLLIGVSGFDPALGFLTSNDASVLITPGPGTIDLSAVAGAFPWLLAPGPTQVLSVNTGYIGVATTLPVPANITYTLPVASATGDIIEITNIGGDLPIIAQNALQSIRFTASQTTVGVAGSLTAVDQFSSIRLLCVVANTDWIVLSHTGNWVVV
jgi:hypothetical protein